MLNPASKTFSIRKLQGLCKNHPNAPGISFIPPSNPKRPPTPALKPLNRNVSPSASTMYGNKASSQPGYHGTGAWASMGK
ncbi:hypothetical protein QFC21_000795 [Naganishia friedmannii]|uniref:Uncharacterized protein n=1 Tax=Naganishia friedmannii TaxID=89922 RepID=A0ACC2W7R0_9TREE|nr:hypothetical protein QFC21_000795 [Naganishia friedmannii]